MPQPTSPGRGHDLRVFGSVIRQLAASYLGLVLVLTLVAGVFIGWFLFGWVIAPVVYVDAKPSSLSVQYQEVLIGYAADSYGSGYVQIEDVAKRLGEGWTKQQVINRINQMIAAGRPGVDRLNLLKSGLIKYPFEVGPLAVAREVPEQPASDSLLLIAGILLLAALVGLLVVSRVRAAQQAVPEGDIDVSELTSAAPPEDETQPMMSVGRASRGVRPVENPVVVGESQKPLVQYTTTYVAGDDRYDVSFSIESSTGDFWGECGVGIGEIVGSGVPDKVTAMEIWLFDKNDSRTVTKFLMSDFCFNDGALKTKLAPKGEAVLIKKGDAAELKTQSLRVSVRVVELVYGEVSAKDNIATNSYFQKVTVELVAWSN
jgi:hypothetical protein